MKTNEVQEIVNKFKELYLSYPSLHLIPTNVEGLYFISNLVKELDIIYKDPKVYMSYFDIYGCVASQYFCTQIKHIPEEIEKLKRPQHYFRKACTDGTFELYFTEDSPKWMRPLRDNNYNTYIRFKK
nr:MAG TPA: hypothetical protein [Caudoviricetes sp.]